MKVKVKLARCRMVYCEKVDGCWQVVENEVETPKNEIKNIRDAVEASGRKLIEFEKVGETVKLCEVPTGKILDYAVENKDDN